MSLNTGKSRLQIAYFSPLPPARSGIADYSSELLPYLAKYADVTLFAATPHEVDTNLIKDFPILPIQDYPGKRWQYEVPLYQMGNSSHHEAIYQMFLRYPGIVTLHDYSLHHFISHRTSGQNHFSGYLRELGYALGQQGLELARQIKLGNKLHQLFDVPLNKRLLDLSLGLIVHSRYAQKLVQSQKSSVPVIVIPQSIPLLVNESRRHKLPWPEDAIIFASVGQITAEKQIEFALSAFKKVHQAIPNTYYLIVGEQTGTANLSSVIDALGLSDYVWLTGHISDEQKFIDWIYSVDIIINLRYPTVGETSRTALCALATGRSLIVFDHGWYSELPDSTCIKVPPLDENALFTAMSQLAQQPQKRQHLGGAGQQYIEREHHPDHVAKAYVAFINQRLSSIQHKYGN